MARVKAVTFDCYGTLIDWERGIREFLMSRFRIPRPRAAAMVRAWEEAQFRRIQEPYRRYREIMAESLAEVCEATGVPYRTQDLADFVADLLAWPVFPDVGELERLRPRSIGVLSNMDTDLLEATVARLPVAIDLIVSAEMVRSYKPARAHFEKAVELLGCAPAEICHCAFGVRYDAGPAGAMGMKTVIVRRSVLPPGSEADAVVGSLSELSEALAAMGA